MQTRIILEMGCNHQGDLNLAKEMILDAHKLGVWAVKFQKRDIEAMPQEERDKLRDPAVSLGETQYEHRKRLEFSIAQLEELKELAHRKGLKFICTAFDKKSYLDLYDMGLDMIKLPSQLFASSEMKKLHAEYPIDIIVSTGMHTLNDVMNNDWTEKATILMHCISVYPAKLHQLNMGLLHNILAYSMPITPGYSSHGINGKDVYFAVLCGAEYIERHYTRSKTMIGNDHETVSSDFDEILQIQKDIEFAEVILGDCKMTLCEEEKAMRDKYVK